MVTWLITHQACLQHDTGHGHPESIDRLRAILTALDAPTFATLVRREAEAATREELARVHQPRYIEQILTMIPSSGWRSLDPDTMISPASGEAALRAAGAVRQAVDAVMSGKATRVFCAVRPPGHHAEPAQAMGFCLFNNVAVGAMHARYRYAARNIAVVDFDVHHGNGTQTMLAGREGFLYASTHQQPLFPNTGRREENRSGALYNIPLPPGAGSETFRKHFRDEIIPALADFQPDLILISAGFDAHESDPLAELKLADEDYQWATTELVALADACCDGRIVSTLEGGYNLQALARSAARHVTALMN